MLLLACVHECAALVKNLTDFHFVTQIYKEGRLVNSDSGDLNLGTKKDDQKLGTPKGKQFKKK
jgi:hypothetical protein